MAQCFSSHPDSVIQHHVPTWDMGYRPAMISERNRMGRAPGALRKPPLRAGEHAAPAVWP